MKLHTEEVRYSAGALALHGFLAIDAEHQEPRPGVLLVHEWWGHDEQIRTRARQVAALGYNALALDMYGEGKCALTPDEAGKAMNAVFSTPGALRARFQAAWNLLAARSDTDASRLAVLGYCFGGAVALEMARQGLPLAGALAFHPGSLATGTRAARGTVRSRVLVLIGEDDPFVPAAQRADFRAEMQAAGVEHEVVSYPGVKHGFTVPAATERGTKYGIPLAYDAPADRDSWARTERFLAAVFE